MSINQSIRSQAEMKKAHVGDLAGSVGRDTTLGGIMTQDEEYQRFVRDKLGIVTRKGIESPIRDYGLFPHQSDLVKWALRRATAAIFADTGLGKSRMQVAWADMVHRHTGGDVLILAPLAVAEQTVEEGRSIGVSVTHAREENQLRPGINITNYDRIHKFNCSKFDGVVLDECFVPDTFIDVLSIDGLTSKKYIKDIREGDKIINVSGVDIVSNVHRREITYAIKTSINGSSIISSPNHPYFTQRGWVGACHLQPGDYVMETAQAMRLLQGCVLSSVTFKNNTKVLRDILFSEMADEPKGKLSENSQSRSGGETRKSKVGMVQNTSCGQGIGENNFTESDDESRNSGKGEPNIESDEAQTFRAWGERSWFDKAAADSKGCVISELDSGICFVTGETASGVSDLLQAGLSLSSTQDSHRIGWSITSQQEGSGQEEGSEVGFSRVESLEILKQGHPELEKYRDADGKLYFYDIGATRHPSFSINGLLVHNSSIIKHHTAKTLQTLLDAFRHTQFKLCATATPAPNDWTELGNHAEFLGVRSRSEMLAEFFVHDAADTGTWRLKGHARNIFWQWVASWGAMIRSPADLGHDASLYALPPLHVNQHTVEIEHNPAHGLFPMEAQSLMERRDARKQSMSERVMACVLKIKYENDKLAESYYAECCHGLETGIRREQEEAGSRKPGTTAEAACIGQSKPSAEQGIPQGIHECVLQEQSGEIPAKNARETGRAQRNTASKVRCGSFVSGTDESQSESLVAVQSEQEEKSTVSGCVWDRVERFSGHADDAEGGVRDLRVCGHEQPEDVSCRGSLPQDREDSRPALCELQSCSGEVQGQHEHLVVRHRIPTEKWLIWCELNDEQDALERALKNSGISYVSVRGNTDLDKRVQYEREWRLGTVQCMISKPSVFGFGLNWQHCRNMAFVGVTDSFEAYYQAVRRCWRFGQKHSVNVHVFASNQEGAVVANLRRKEMDAKEMADAMAIETIDAIRSEVLGRTKETNIYRPDSVIRVPKFLEVV